MTKAITKNLENEAWYQSLTEDCQAILTEGIWNYRLTLIKTYHLLGRRILEENDNFKREKVYGEKICQHVGESLGKSRQTIQYAVQFAGKYPDLDRFMDSTEEQKVLSWHKIVQKYLPEPKEKDIPLPKGKYQVILADPGWDYGKPQHGKVGNEDTDGAHSHYTVKSDEEIAKLDVARLAAEDCLLFIWVGGPKLKAAFIVSEAWGFEYATVGFVWHKQKPNPGEYTMSECEYCLIFKKGKIPQPRGARNIRQFYSEKRTKHSAKPAEIRKRIEAMFPKQKKIELFAREKAQNWDSWGDEI